jgi:hypothetical protein
VGASARDDADSLVMLAHGPRGAISSGSCVGCKISTRACVGRKYRRIWGPQQAPPLVGPKPRLPGRSRSSIGCRITTRLGAWPPSRGDGPCVTCKPGAPRRGAGRRRASTAGRPLVQARPWPREGARARRPTPWRSPRSTAAAPRPSARVDRRESHVVRQDRGPPGRPSRLSRSGERRIGSYVGLHQWDRAGFRVRAMLEGSPCAAGPDSVP